VFVFGIMFFYVAPIIQISSLDSVLVNFYPVQDPKIIFANIIVFTFLMTFSVFYLWRQQKLPAGFQLIGKRLWNFKANSRWFERALPTLCIASGVIAVCGAFDSISSVGFAGPSAETDLAFLDTVKSKLLFMIPFATLSFYMLSKKQRLNFALVIFLSICVLLT